MTSYVITQYDALVDVKDKVVKFVKPREASEILGVDVRTLVKWEQSGQINAIKTPSGQRCYDIDRKNGSQASPISGRLFSCFFSINMLSYC
ncbi:MerR family DNA-binding transcriptional regulator [Okeania sp. SIO3B5]|uniref:MerR family DNA-binding transcriptional regulator n=1 Tax=Okeania sp. SIO3B5 TaxID=2607811 RepID=UPI0025FBD706|nr:MerR family DNA-binding transcriptional regulator [Okeania sp. SIO3B5]